MNGGFRNWIEYMRDFCTDKGVCLSWHLTTEYIKHKKSQAWKARTGCLSVGYKNINVTFRTQIYMLKGKIYTPGSLGTCHVQRWISFVLLGIENGELC